MTLLTGAIRVRSAALGDEALLLAWRNDAETRRYSRSTDIVGFDEHKSWFLRSLDDPNRLLLICEDESGEPFATVRFDATTTEDPIEFEVSISVAPIARGCGSSQIALRACEQFALQARSIQRFKAYINRANARSLRLFEGCGYLATGEGDSEGVWLARDVEIQLVDPT